MGRITTKDLIDARKAVQNDPKFGTYSDIEKVIYKKYKYNKDAGIVALKIAYIDHTNSTNLRMDKNSTIAKLAEQIVNIDFDRRVRKGDINLVDEIANMGDRKLLSFASKYCLFHNYNAYNKDDYSIWDSVVRNALPGLLKDIGVNRKKSELYDYVAYCDAINLLIKHYKLSSLKHPRRDLDTYIWWTYRNK